MGVQNGSACGAQHGTQEQSVGVQDGNACGAQQCAELEGRGPHSCCRPCHMEGDAVWLATPQGGGREH